jgi:hypothetical protein
MIFKKNFLVASKKNFLLIMTKISTETLLMIPPLLLRDTYSPVFTYAGKVLWDTFCKSSRVKEGFMYFKIIVLEHLKRVAEG